MTLDHLRLALDRVTSALIQQLTRRDRLRLQRDRHCDVITAILQAASPKRSNPRLVHAVKVSPADSRQPVKLSGRARAARCATRERDYAENENEMPDCHFPLRFCCCRSAVQFPAGVQFRAPTFHEQPGARLAD